jgi:hypothetical protein
MKLSGLILALAASAEAFAPLHFGVRRSTCVNAEIRKASDKSDGKIGATSTY